MLKRTRPWMLPLLAVLAMGCATFLRGRISAARVELGLVPPAALEVEVGVGRRLAGQQVILASAGLGVFRPVALDLLWLRAARLQERGEHFEARALAKLITGLEPRIPEVWCFQARNLAYNIPPAFPPRERFPWIVRGIELLRDDALRFNPDSAVILLELAFIFQHKIGLDFDDAGFIYRSELAAIFEVDPSSSEGAGRWRQWGLDAGRVAALEASLGQKLDFRAAESHALYWAALGLSSPGARGWLHGRLQFLKGAALRQLLDGGKPLRAADGPRYAFLPDLRFLAAAEAALRAELATSVPARDAPGILAGFEATTAVHLFLDGDEAGSRARFDAARRDLKPAASELEEVLLQWMTLDGEKPLALAADDCLAASLLAERGGAGALSRGLERLASLVLSRGAPSTAAGAPGLEERKKAASSRLESGQPPGELPFHLEQLTPKEPRPGEIPPGRG